MDRNEKIERFKALPTGNVSDAMDKLGIRRGVITGLVQLSPEQPMAVGFARTIKQMKRHQTANIKDSPIHSKVIDERLEPGDILVIDVNGHTDVCTGGALLALRAKMRGANGFIVNGCMRDKREIINLGFPVYTCGITPIKSSPDLQTVGVDVPVEINGVQIRPGDMIIADDTGIIVVPDDYTQKVLELAEEISTKEEKVVVFIRQGKSFIEAASESKL